MSVLYYRMAKKIKIKEWALEAHFKTKNFSDCFTYTNNLMSFNSCIFVINAGCAFSINP